MPASLLPLLLLFPRLSLGQGVLPMTIQNISCDDTIDLYKMFNGDGIVDPQNTLILWDFYNANGPIVRAFSTFSESVEFLAGPAEQVGNNVVDIVGKLISAPSYIDQILKVVRILGTNIIYDTFTYWTPASLPLGLYHYRINATVNTTISTGGFDIQNVTARSPTVNVTTSKPIGCGKAIPPPYHNTTSLTSSEYTSLYVYDPSAGFNAHPDDQNKTFVSWAYRDSRNTLPDGTGVSNFTVQVIDATTSNPIGPVQTPAKGDNWSTGMSFKVPDVPLAYRGTYKIVVKYINSVQDGLVSPGNVVTHTSEMFNWVTFDDFQDDCANVAAATGTGSTSPGSTGTSKPNHDIRIAPTLVWLSLLIPCGTMTALSGLY
ncbi:hypothetical protein H0H93_007081 [Arthromyces matolae]|nr:hypothetical protein H0H93_007081 [Arthromyces matolae]